MPLWTTRFRAARRPSFGWQVLPIARWSYQRIFFDGLTVWLRDFGEIALPVAIRGNRLELAGAKGAPHFTGPAFWRIFGYSRGIPRLINSICDKALLAGFVEHSDRITYRLVGRAIRELEGHIRV